MPCFTREFFSQKSLPWFWLRYHDLGRAVLGAAYREWCGAACHGWNCMVYCGAATAAWFCLWYEELSDEPQLCYYVNIIWNHNAIQMNKWIFLFWHRHNHLRSIILQSYHISIVFIFWFRWKSSHFDFFHSYCSLSLSLFCSPSFPCCISFSFSFSWNVYLAESFPCINWKLIWLSSN